MTTRVNLATVHGDLLDQDVDAIVNAWNRNIIPWWLLIPQGVSGAIKRRAGTWPFRELARHGPMPLGSAVWTTAGSLPFRGIVHVAGIDMLWRASERSIRDSVRNAIAVATDISDRKRAEAERQLLETQLRQQQRLESLGTLASGVAHEQARQNVEAIIQQAEGALRQRLGDPQRITQLIGALVASPSEQAYAREELRRAGTLAMPVIGAGSGGFDEATACALIEDEVSRLASPVQLTLVRYRPR